MSNGKIFISYRREDTSGESGRLKDKLEQDFGKENIFYDVETLEAGLNFDESIAKALNESKVLLVMIGPHWLRVTDSNGIKRIQKDEDWVRKEIAQALKKNIRVIPVLVNGADMPDSQELPEDLKDLTLRHAQELTSSRWNYDVGELTKVLEKIIAKKPTYSDPRPTPHPFVSPVPKPKSWWAKNYLWALGGIVGFLILVGMCVPDEEIIYPIQDSNLTLDSVLETEVDIHAQSPEGNEIYNSLQLDNPSSQPLQPTVSDSEFLDVSGYWILRDLQGNQSTLAFTQNGPDFAFYEYNILNIQIGYGSGRIEGNTLYSEYYNTLVEVGGNLEMTASNGGQNWSGRITFPVNNISSQITLSRN